MVVVVVAHSGAAAQVVPTSEWVSVWSDATRLNTNPVPVGAVIRAYDPDGVLCGEFQVNTRGSYGLMAVYRDDTFTTVVDEGAEPGDTLRFTVDGLPARTVGPDAAVWTQNGAVLSVDLAAEKVFPTSEWASFWSDATEVRGIPVAPGAVVRAYDPVGVLCGQFTVTSPGSYGLMAVYRDDPSTLDFDEGASPGDALVFTIDGADASELGPDAAVWTANGYVGNVDLSVVLVSTTLVASKLEVVSGAVEIRWALAVPIDPEDLRLLRRHSRDGIETPTGLVIDQEGYEYRAIDRDVDSGVTYTYRLRIDGEDGLDIIELGTVRIAPPAFALSPAYPNPFRLGTTLQFDLAGPAAVTLVVHDAAGHRIRRLLDRASYPAGRHEVFWDGRDYQGHAVPVGVYFVRMLAGKFQAAGKITVVR
jgi:hypothetical protein